MHCAYRHVWSVNFIMALVQMSSLLYVGAKFIFKIIFVAWPSVTMIRCYPFKCELWLIGISVDPIVGVHLILNLFDSMIWRIELILIAHL